MENETCPDSRKSKFPRWLEWKLSMYGSETKWIYTSVCVETDHVRMSEKVDFQRKGALQIRKEGHINLFNNVVMVDLSTSASVSLCVYIHVHMYS